MTQPIVKTLPLATHIRWMIRRDMDQVLAIEEEVFLNEWACPWTKEEFIRCSRQRNCIGMVAEGIGEFEDKVLGYMMYELERNGLYIINLAVAAAVQRRKIGSQLIAKLRSKLSAERRCKIELNVCEANLAAQQFLSHEGFIASGIDYDFYGDYGNSRHAAIKFRYRFNPDRDGYDRQYMEEHRGR